MKNKKEKEELKIDESLLTPEQQEELHKRRLPIGYLIVVGTLIVASVVCIILIKVL